MRELLRILAEPDRDKRIDLVRDIAQTSKASVAGFERALARLPRPWLPEERRGSFEAKLPLWGGSMAEVLETEVVVYVPTDIPEGKLLPLVVASHGSGGTAAGAAAVWQQAAQQHGLIVIAASEQVKNEGHMGADHERWTVASLRRWALLHLPVDPDRVFKSGVSRGGHITWDVTTRWPDLWAGAAPFIGGPRLDPSGGISNLRLVENLVPMTIRDLQGVGDDPGLLFNLKLAFDMLAKAGARDAKLELQKKHGHSFDMRAVDWAAFFATRRDPLPRRIVFRSVDLDEARCHWLRIRKFDKEVVKNDYRPQAKASAWKSLSNDGKKKWILEDSLKHTARVALRFEDDAAKNERTVFIEDERGVKAMDAVFPRELWPVSESGQAPMKVFVQRGKTRKAVAVEEDLELWLLDVVERADPRTAAVVRIPLDKAASR